MINYILLSSFILALFISLPLHSSNYEFDIFGSDRLDIAKIQKEFGSKLSTWAEAWSQKKLHSWDLVEQNAKNLQQELEEDICKSYDFAFVQVTGLHFNTDQVQKDFVIIDVVEKEDQANRMPFKSPQKGNYPDPEGIFATWTEYINLASELWEKGLLTSEDMNDTRDSFHTVFGHLHPELAPYRKLAELVRKHSAEIQTIFLDDADENNRANAASLLAYLQDGQYLISLLQKGLKDSSSAVRNNVMRVYVYIAMKHPEFDLPIDEIVEALKYPSFLDRNKAVSTLYMLALNPEQLNKYRASFMKALPSLVKLLTQKQPNVHDPAYFILKTLSNKDFGPHNIQGWQQWLVNEFICEIYIK